MRELSAFISVPRPKLVALPQDIETRLAVLGTLQPQGLIQGGSSIAFNLQDPIFPFLPDELCGVE